MLEYYSWILKLAIFVFSGLTIIGAFCSVGWLLTERELKKERFFNSALHNKVRSQSLEIENLKAKNNFLLNRVGEEKAKAAEFEFEKISLEDRLQKALGAVRSQVDEKTDCNSTDETAEV